MNYLISREKRLNIEFFCFFSVSDNGIKNIICTFAYIIRGLYPQVYAGEYHERVVLRRWWKSLNVSKTPNRQTQFKSKIP